MLSKGWPILAACVVIHEVRIVMQLATIGLNRLNEFANAHVGNKDWYGGLSYFTSYTITSFRRRNYILFCIFLNLLLTIHSRSVIVIVCYVCGDLQDQQRLSN